MSKLLKSLLIHAKLRTGEGEESTDDSGVKTNEETGEAVGSGNDARLALLNGINDRNDEARADELQEIHDDNTVTPFKVEAVTEDPEEQAAREAQEVEAARQAAEAAAKAEETAPAKPAEASGKVTRVINGREVEITDEMIARIFQSQETTDETAEQQRAQAAREQSAQQEENRLTDIVRAIQLGTEEEALAAVKALKKETAPDLSNLDRLIDEKLHIKEATEKFAKDYQDIVTDPVLMSWAIQADIELQRKGDKRSHSERYSAIGNNIRDWVKSKIPQQQTTETPAAATPTVEVSTAKQQSKAAAPAFPKAAGGKHAPVAEEESDESAADVIAEMAKKRGGPQWMNGTSR